MITNSGKDILAKYMIGHAPAYASHLAFGSGATPLSTSDNFDLSGYAEKKTLDFEMFRAPIISRGYVTENVVDENGVVQVDTSGNILQYSEIVFTAELPTNERYEISEIGVYSAGSNPSASSNDSRILQYFSNNDNWEYHTETAASSLPTHIKPLDQDSDGILLGPEGQINVEYLAFNANADNSVLDNNTRISRNERPRFLNNALFMRGDACSVYGSGSGIYYDENPESATYDVRHIHINSLSSQLGLNAPTDELKLAFSVINKDPDGPDPGQVKIIVEFSTPEGADNPQSARLKIHKTSVQDDFGNNRYFVETQKLEDLERTSEFSWDVATSLKIYASVLDSSGAFSSDYYVCLDGLRIDNVTSASPLYALTGYTVAKTATGTPIIKSANTANLVEFRFAMDVA